MSKSNLLFDQDDLSQAFRPTGWWEIVRSNRQTGIVTVECSVCHKTSSLMGAEDVAWIVEDDRFCHDCGARMLGVRQADNVVYEDKHSNAARIRAMSDQVLADFLHEVGVAEPPWDKEFSQAFCDDCMACETAVGLIDCPYGRPVDWWLEQEASK